jgi:hypothetical protein
MNSPAVVYKRRDIQQNITLSNKKKESSYKISLFVDNLHRRQQLMGWTFDSKCSPEVLLILGDMTEMMQLY